MTSKRRLNFNLFFTLSDVITYAKSIEELVEIRSRDLLGEAYGMILITGGPRP